MNTSKCEGTNRSGGPCSATPQTGKDWCVWHDPALAEQRHHWNRSGGKAKSNAARAKRRVLEGTLELAHVDAALCGALMDVLEGRLEPSVGTAAATIARTVSAIRTTSDLEQRLAALEDRAAARRGWPA